MNSTDMLRFNLRWLTIAASGALLGYLGWILSRNGAADPFALAAILTGASLPLLLLWFVGSVSRAPGIDLTADAPTFYPNRNSEHRLLVLRLNLTRAARVDIEIFDEFDRHIMTLTAPSRFGAGEHFRLWDGRERSGALLSEGSYRVVVSARSLTARTVSSVWVRLDATLEPRRRATRPLAESAPEGERLTI